MEKLIIKMSILILGFSVYSQETNFTIKSEFVVLENDTIPHKSTFEKSGVNIRWIQSRRARNHESLMKIISTESSDAGPNESNVTIYTIEENPYPSLITISRYNGRTLMSLRTERPEGREEYEFIVSEITYK